MGWVKLEISFEFCFKFLKDSLASRMEIYWKGQWKARRPLRKTIAEVVRGDDEFERRSGGVDAIYYKSWILGIMQR